MICLNLSNVGNTHLIAASNRQLLLLLLLLRLPTAISAQPSCNHKAIWDCMARRQLRKQVPGLLHNATFWRLQKQACRAGTSSWLNEFMWVLHACFTGTIVLSMAAMAWPKPRTQHKIKFGKVEWIHNSAKTLKQIFIWESTVLMPPS